MTRAFCLVAFVVTLFLSSTEQILGDDGKKEELPQFKFIALFTKNRYSPQPLKQVTVKKVESTVFLVGRIVSEIAPDDKREFGWVWIPMADIVEIVQFRYADELKKYFDMLK